MGVTCKLKIRRSASGYYPWEVLLINTRAVRSTRVKTFEDALWVVRQALDVGFFLGYMVYAPTYRGYQWPPR